MPVRDLRTKPDPVSLGPFGYPMQSATFKAASAPHAAHETVQFSPKQDRLWFVGDLVNRGPDSLKVLRVTFVLSAAASVLGNHDIFLLAVAAGLRISSSQ